MKKITIAVMTALMTGCASIPQPQPIEVKVPIAVSCVRPEQIPVKPDYESLRDKDNTLDGTVVLHIARDLAKSLPYQAELEAILISCASTPR